MKIHHIAFKNTGFFSNTMLDYLKQDEKIVPFYNNFPNLKGFQSQIKEKQNSFQLSSRLSLIEALENQYNNFETSFKTLENLNKLKLENTFTITTGHQLNLFTGPLYFLYKIISTINLCEELSQKFPEKNFVPVYWMATEDHDFEEINYFNFQQKKVLWNRANGGAVGRFSTNGLEEVFSVFSNHLGNSKNANFLRNLFTKAYLEQPTLADATRYIANKLFGNYGLVIVDGDDKNLKKHFSPFALDELENNTSFTTVSETNKNLEKNYNIQVNPREINLFYLGDNFRERIIFEDNLFKVNNTNITFTKEQIVAKLASNPEVFSPNVIMRPLYQEVILPNLCYVGGGGEIAYWMQLKDYFKKINIPFPILLLRNSAQIVSKKQAKKLTKLGITLEEIFLKQSNLIEKKVLLNADINSAFDGKLEYLKQHFIELKEVAKKTDVSFLNAVNAQEKKQINGLRYLKKRLLQAEKRKQKDLVSRIIDIQNQLLPNNSLEERQRNFSEFYLDYGDSFIEAIKSALKPLQLQFTVLEL